MTHTLLNTDEENRSQDVWMRADEGTGPVSMVQRESGLRGVKLVSV